MSLGYDQDSFEFWLMDMDDAIERLFSLLPSEVTGHLDYSEYSLNHIEKWILDQYMDTNSIIEKSEKMTLDGLARYVGETFRMAFKGKWIISLDDPDKAFHMIPQVIFSDYEVNSISPVTLVTASADRRLGNYLSTVYRNVKQSKKALYKGYFVRV
ncbi:hypothetical protein GXN76_08230 [Kroppenstedtia pulmonis]|uniref:Uncharacterized protein n=2 Tax=Kroppenstedtia pulmonis TaxID=1380685 RepID=A0A7D4B444_9BACL|nr:hypothetical protein GXN76_08230 [Kroppenstedtia pulmonis]